MNYAEFLAYFRRMIGQKTAWASADSNHQPGHPVYDHQMREFADEFKRSLDYNSHAKRTLRTAEIEPKIDHESMGEVMLTNDPKLVKAMLSLIIDGESLHEGTWADALTEGFFFQLLSALCPATVITG